MALTLVVQLVISCFRLCIVLGAPVPTESWEFFPAHCTDKSPEIAFQAEVFSDLHHLLERDGEPTDDILENRMEAALMAAQGKEVA